MAAHITHFLSLAESANVFKYYLVEIYLRGLLTIAERRQSMTRLVTKRRWVEKCVSILFKCA